MTPRPTFFFDAPYSPLTVSGELRHVKQLLRENPNLVAPDRNM